jgi:hypothetical protein
MIGAPEVDTVNLVERPRILARAPTSANARGSRHDKAFSHTLGRGTPKPRQVWEGSDSGDGRASSRSEVAERRACRCSTSFDAAKQVGVMQ